MDSLPKHGAYKFLPYASTTAPPPPSLKIKHTSTWTYCGPLLTPASLPPSLQTWSTHATSSPSSLAQHLHPLLTFLHTFLRGAGVQHYWLTLRATLPTHEYDTRRWHVDDDFFSAVGSAARDAPSFVMKGGDKGGWKLCATLLGAPTLFLPPSSNATALSTLRSVARCEAAKRPHTCSSIRCAGCFDTGLAVRRVLAALFADKEMVQAKAGEVVLFCTGGEQGAVHSEPMCDAERVFVNIVPGSEAQLRALMGRFGMVFPRAWSLGVPVCADNRLDGLGGKVYEG
ncbi:uncharacterized protein M421DRAFT_71042 [Didymella exigua CBS 183.55]|uniref:Uncharacterized protein n=1 Tax=Didymella exigua CBS 183.55 TaxID=1150837 RepID=A0A6A5RHE8_9PLEO|nr:uncharacterized protein M421DRAFT_71042 [Didymella exigua CBS 183.55]KAF1925027.1 hypothetical protein M421DRAFT_71042 [Didymella exigua CBS 183.55]